LATSAVKSALEVCAQVDGPTKLAKTDCLAASAAIPSASGYVRSVDYSITTAITSTADGVVKITAVESGATSSTTGEDYELDGAVNHTTGKIVWDVNESGSSCRALGIC
jgi:hypothetical protein